jgi:hypothetical protein
MRPHSIPVEAIMAKMSGGRAVVESLRTEGVRYVYGIVGSCMVEFLDDMYDRRDIGWVSARAMNRARPTWLRARLGQARRVHVKPTFLTMAGLRFSVPSRC